ncbi:phage holin family protein [Pseudotabrizicola algicola]|uniref:Phage holin family protein n=1 Tax=Pseudotabrizicola algicola TaxID=2709381 RepID=A0A6B3RMR0_9RHOB|nr:phage holin family protein [Pseudotabrizicola algicola]NEX46486.1 phage holin family protein [Pseudotabrizicola algicola]
MIERDPLSPQTESGPGGIAGLLADLIRDVTGIVRGEGRLIRTELSQGLKSMAAGAEMMVAGAIFLLVAALVLVQALVIALAEWVGPGWASVIVGAALGIIGALLIARGRTSLSAAELMPDRTLQQTSRDIRLAKEHL